MSVLRTLVGIDVGGTNTDAVLIDGTQGRILASCKTPTTRYVGDGISLALEKVLEGWTAGGERQGIVDSLVRINIGTTQFLNAVIERDAQKLSRVALLRLCGPYTRELPGFAGIPAELRNIIEGSTAYLSGGLEYNGKLIAPLDEAEIRRTAADLRDQNLLNIAIVGVHTSIDFSYRQEETVDKILREELGPGATITLSRDIAGIGLLERENATVINAALRPLAETTVANLRHSLTALGIRAPAFFTQNNGTLISASEAKRLPILTYLSGPINSLTGAAFLSKGHGPFEKDVIVVDVGGTTTDTCVLQPSGLPRTAAAFSLLSGARTTFPVPDLRSIGLGGGSLVHVDEKTGGVTVGPDSVGYQLESRAQIFGGSDLTITDVIYAKGEGSPIGKYATNPDASRVKISTDIISKAEKAIVTLLETVVDETKTEAGAVDIILVGGGTFLVPSTINGVGKIYRPDCGHVANAVGAAMARISHKIDRIVSFQDTTEEQELARQCDQTVEEALAKGVLKPHIVEKTTMALSYSSTREVRMITTAVGDAPLDKPTAENTDDHDPHSSAQNLRNEPTQPASKHATPITDPTKNARAYRPSVSSGKWKLSPTDLYFLAEGCGILGCGGGGDTYQSFLSALSLLENGEDIYVIDPSSVPDDGAVPAVGFMGSPSILSERFPSGQELKNSVDSVAQYQGHTKSSLAGVISLEIGGSNGFRGIQAAAWTHTPIIDADLMGRAYPNLWQTTLTRARIPITPCAVSDAKGNTLIHHRAASHQDVENFLRPLCSEMGNAAGTSFALLNGQQIRDSTVHHSLSWAWRLGRAVYIARQEKTSVVDAILNEYPGRLVFKGKIVQVKRDISGGFSRGFIDVIQSNLGTNSNSNNEGEEEGEAVRVEFQNENLRVTGKDGKAFAIVPDLITVLDSETGSAVGTQDYRYGLHVLVVALVASPQWSEKEGLEIGGPAAFELQDEYVPVAEYRAVRSVIEDYGT